MGMVLRRGILDSLLAMPARKGMVARVVALKREGVGSRARVGFGREQFVGSERRSRV